MITGLNPAYPNMIPFSYGHSITLAASSANVSVLTLANDSQFLLQAIFATCTKDVDTDFTSNNFSVQIQDGGTGRLFSNIRIPQRAGIGNAFFGVQEAQGLLFAPNTNIQFDVLDLSADTNVVTFVLKGYKIFVG